MHNRHSIRHPHHDYRRTGWYFVTICAETRRMGRVWGVHARGGDHDHRGEHKVRPYGDRWVFGDVVRGRMVLNAAGKMVGAVWRTLPARFPHITLDEFVVMPDHFHGLLFLSPMGKTDAPAGRALCGPPAGSLGQVVQAFKSESTLRYGTGVRDHGWPPFRRRLWQRNYFESIIRDDSHLRNTRRYIALNPARYR